jgi:phosphopantothenoylcysteine decarboxylase / phosphopantothenate---cysteine ligase
MHPSEEIYCEKSSKLRGKTIVIGITGSIAATECFSTIRELLRHGAQVLPVMTEAAARLVTPESLEFASGVAPITELTGQTEHVKWMGSNAADMLLIYPATANTISKIANGIDDTPVTSMATVALGSNIPVAIAPAMHESMFRNPAVQRNMDALRSWGISFIGPMTDGVRAKVASKEAVVAWVFKMMSKDDLKGKRILIIGGRSEEPLDSMRMITNRSTGLMAVSLAIRAFERGAEVEMWMGGCNVPLPDYIPTRRFEAVSDLVGMVDSVDHDMVIVPAALADFAPAEEHKGKIPSDKAYDMLLNPVPKVLPLIRARCDKVIGFKAESGMDKTALAGKARARLKEYNLTAVIANDVDVSGKSSTSVILVTPDKDLELTGSKMDVSNAILDFCAER